MENSTLVPTHEKHVVLLLGRFFANGDVRELIRLVRKYGGPLLNGNTKICYEQFTLLRAASRLRSAELIEVLLNIKETDPFLPDSHGERPMYFFPYFGNHSDAEDLYRRRVVDLFAAKDVRLLNMKESPLLNQCIDYMAGNQFIFHCMRRGAWVCDARQYDVPPCSPREFMNGMDYHLVKNRKLVLAVLQMGHRLPVRLPRELWERVARKLVWPFLTDLS